MFNRSEILRSAWADYRRDVKFGFGIARYGAFVRSRFAYCLRMAWAVAKERAAKAAAEPNLGPVATIMTAVNLLPVVKVRIAEIECELREQEYGDFINWPRRSELRAELGRLAA